MPASGAGEAAHERATAHDDAVINATLRGRVEPRSTIEPMPFRSSPRTQARLKRDAAGLQRPAVAPRSGSPERPTERYVHSVHDITQCYVHSVHVSRIRAEL